MCLKSKFSNKPTIVFTWTITPTLTRQVRKVKMKQVVTRVMIPGSRWSGLQSASRGKTKQRFNHRVRLGKCIRRSKTGTGSVSALVVRLCPLTIALTSQGARWKHHHPSWRRHRCDVTRLIWPDTGADQLQLLLINPAVWLLTGVWGREGCQADSTRWVTTAEDQEGTAPFSSSGVFTSLKKSLD